jgi:hypothetical protein
MGWRELIVAGGIALLIWASSPAYTVPSGRSPVIVSVSNAKQVMTMLSLYALDHDGLLPPDLKTACEYTGMDSSLLVSPIDPAHREYTLLCPGVKLADLPAATPVIRDPCEWRGKTITGYAGGQVKMEMRTAPP